MPPLCKLKCSGTSIFILSFGSLCSSGLMTPYSKTDGNHRRGRHANAAGTHCDKTGSKPATRLRDALRQRPETSGVWLYLATFVCQNKCRAICSSFPVSLHLGQIQQDTSALLTQEGKEMKYLSTLQPNRKEKLCEV